MKLLHPIFMLGFIFWLYKQRSLGMSLLDRHGRLASDETDAETSRAKHRFWGMILTGYCFAGLIGGAIMTGMVYPEITIPFGQTYGHGYIGTLGFGCLVMSLVLGFSIKRVVKPKIRERFVTFHTNMIFLIAAFAVLSLLTGAGLLVFGPSQVVTQIQVTP